MSENGFQWFDKKDCIRLTEKWTSVKWRVKAAVEQAYMYFQKRLEICTNNRLKEALTSYISLSCKQTYYWHFTVQLGLPHPFWVDTGEFIETGEVQTSSCNAMELSLNGTGIHWIQGIQGIW